jgi:hypothetical protein
VSCTAKIFHGPGHQSRTLCCITHPHTIHAATYGRLDTMARWRGQEVFSGYHDEPPELDVAGEEIFDAEALAAFAEDKPEGLEAILTQAPYHSVSQLEYNVWAWFREQLLSGGIDPNGSTAGALLSRHKPVVPGLTAVLAEAAQMRSAPTTDPGGSRRVWDRERFVDYFEQHVIDTEDDGQALPWAAYERLIEEVLDGR